MKRALRIGLMVLLTLVLLVGVGGLVLRGLEGAENVRANANARDIADLPDPAPPLRDKPEQSPAAAAPEPEPDFVPEPEPAFEDDYAASLLDVDLAELQGVNSDVLGWISIPDTPIFYPLLQGEDNSYYLNHTWQKEYNSAGSIFVECQNSADFSSFNTIIYGHRMSDSSMFNSLRHYSDGDYLAEHPRIYIATETGVRVYEVFAAMEVIVTDPVYWLIADQVNYKQKMIEFCLEQSVVDVGATPGVEDSLLTLSTCTSMAVSDDRWVVVAVQVGVVERLPDDT